MILFAIYLLKVIVCSAILLVYYWVALRHKTFHQWNRFYLLLVVVVSLTLPFIKIKLPFESSQASEVVRYFSVSSVDESVVVMTKSHFFLSFSAENWAFAIYVSICCLFLLFVIQGLKEVIGIIRKYPCQKLKQVYFLDTDAKGAPFSFFNYIIWNHEIDLTSKTGQQIFQHELAHVQQKHTLDKIFLLLVLIPFWINPFFWLIRKELHAIHEFLADQQALEDGSAEDLSKMILNSLYPQKTFLLSNHLFQSSIKRRLHMFAIKNQKISYLSRVLVLPLIVIMGAAFTIKEVQLPQTTNKTITQEKSRSLENKKQLEVASAPALDASKPDTEKNADKQPVQIQSNHNNMDLKEEQNGSTKQEQSEPKFIGNWQSFLKNLDPAVPVNNGAPAGSYTVEIKFLVSKEGKLSDFKTLTSHGFGMEEEVIKLMKKSPDWEPAQQNGIKVAAYKVQKVTFAISEQ